MTQKAAILQHLMSGKSLTPLEALHMYGCFRLASVVFTLKQEGHLIKTTMVHGANNKRYASYSALTREDLFNGREAVNAALNNS